MEMAHRIAAVLLTQVDFCQAMRHLTGKYVFGGNQVMLFVLTVHFLIVLECIVLEYTYNCLELRV